MHSKLIALCAVAMLAAACTTISAKDGEVKTRTFGTSSVTVEAGDEGVTAQAEGSGTNVLGIFGGLFDAAKDFAARFFGGGGDTIVQVEPAEADAE